MISIYDGDVFNMNIENYDRSEILKWCWQFSNCEKFRFLILSGDKIVGAMSYYDILFKRELLLYIISMGDGVFDEARKVFSERQKSWTIPCLNEQGECLFLLERVEEKMPKVPSYQFKELYNRIVNSEHKLRILDHKDTLDYYIVEDKDIIIFEELTDYSYGLACLFIEKFSDKEIVFLDEKAKYFWEYGVQIYRHIFELENKIKDKKYTIITSPIKENNSSGIPDIITNIYNCVDIMISMLWCARVKHYGNKNKGKKIVLINFNTGEAGLAHILCTTYMWHEMIKREGMIPVVDYSSFPNQYLAEEGDNMWEYFFAPVSDISIDEVYQSDFVINLKENLNFAHDEILNINLRRQAGIFWSEVGRKENNFNNVIKINDGVYEFIRRNMRKEFEAGNRILGIVMRGTDYRKNAAGARGRMGTNYNLGAEGMIKRIRQILLVWEYDYIYVATEDKIYLDELIDAFGDMVIYNDQKRICFNEKTDNDKLVADMLQVQGNREFSLNYLTILYSLSKCNGLLSSINCGARIIARCWNCGEYQIEDIVK